MIRTKKFENLPQITSISPSGKIVVTENGVDKVISFEDFSNLPPANDVWNNASTTFTASEVNVTDIQSAADSKLLDLKVNTVSKFKVDKFGKITGNALQIGDSTLASPGYVNISNTGVITFSGSGTGIYEQAFILPGGGGYFRRDGASVINSLAGEQGNQYVLNQAGLRLGNVAYVGWSSGNAIAYSSDTFLFRDGVANILAMRNGVNAQALRLYNTYTSSTNFERLNLRWDSNVLKIGTEKGSAGGVARDLAFETDAATRMTVTSAGNVGIGTSSPNYLFSVKPYSGNPTHIGQIGIRNFLGGASPALYIEDYTGLSSVKFGYNDSGTFQIRTSFNNNQVMLESAGYITRITGNGTFMEAGNGNATFSNGNNSIFLSPNYTDYAIHFTAGPSERMRILGSNGNVGIGTTSPNVTLETVGTIRSSLSGFPSYYTEIRADVSLGNILRTSGNPTFTIQPNGTTVLTLTAGATANNYLSGNLQVGNSKINGVADIAYIDLYNPTTGNIHIANTSANLVTGNILFETGSSATERMRISSAGNLGLGTSAPLAKLDIAETWNSNISVTGASGTGSVATITFATQAAVIPVGATVVVGSINPSGYNGTFVVTASTVTSISYTNSTTATYVSGGTVQQLFTAVKTNVTDTASASNSLLMDLQVGGATKFKINKLGQLDATSGDIVVAGLFGANRGFYVKDLGNYQISFRISYYGSTFYGPVGITGADTGAPDIIWMRDAAGTLAQRNGVNPQTSRIYGTYTDASNYARLAISCDTSGNAILATEGLGTGAAGTLSINGVPVGLGKGNISSNIAIGTSALTISSTGNNTAIGYFSSNAVTSQNNVSVGAYSLQNNNSGHNVGIGPYTLQQGGAFESVAVGAFCFQKMGGSSNTAIGAYAMQGTNFGSGNNAFGRHAGRYITDGTTSNYTCNNSIFIGANTKALADNQTNQIVIGDSAIGIGSNSVVLGNDSILTTALKGNVGIGTTSPASKLDIADTTLAGSGSLAGSILNLAQTWNTTGAPTAIKLNVTNTASGAASNLLDLQVGTVSKLKVSKGGSVFSGAAIGTNAGNPGADGLSFEMFFAGYGMGTNSNGDAVFYQNNVARTRVGFGVAIANTHSLGFTDATHVGSGVSVDTALFRDAAGTLAQRNGINAQTFRLYNTYTDATTFERLNIKWDTNVLKIGTEKGSVGGTARNLELQIDGTTRLTLTSANADFGVMVRSGGFFCNGGSGLMLALDGNYNTGIRLQSFVEGICRIANASGTDFNRLQFGGTTSSFPAIKRNGAALQIRLADDSANAALETAGLTVVGSASVSGHLSAATKSFLIDHPTKEGKKLQYGVVESNQHSVFVRGKTVGNIIELPEEWAGLVHEDSVTVQLTPIGSYQQLFVISQDNQRVVVGGSTGQYNYTIYGERKDVDKLITEI